MKDEFQDMKRQGMIDVFSVLYAVRLHVMDAQKPRLPLLEQREIEARIVGPLGAGVRVSTRE